MSKQDINLEKTDLSIGIMALTDCAPLVVAQKLGYFKQYGLNVSLHVQPSWATLRDRLQADILDAAQMLAPMPLASTLGLHGPAVPMISAFNLSMNGNGITLSASLIKQIVELNNGVIPPLPLNPKWLGKWLEMHGSKRKLTFAVVYPYSCHFYQLLDWLKQANININEHIDVVVIPPTGMTEAMESNDIDGFCVGNPWNAKAVRLGIGTTVITSCDIWQDAPEKILAVNKRWQQAHPNTFLAMLSAVQQACEWLSSHANRFETAIWLTEYLDEPLEVIAPSLMNSCITSLSTEARDVPAYNRFISNGANKPTREQAQILVNKMKESQQLASDFSIEQSNKLIDDVYRPDLYEQMLEIKPMTQLGDNFKVEAT